ncbi:unnamed protein product [Periconia digitata]|uniref:Serine hydrolase domain-containing protein n=1 Tax=Periconia digitata TaxID=1303443 RepID=A0A9W4UBZ2_9PLEO|nr:unnamed protein product [Periconia digitata]
MASSATPLPTLLTLHGSGSSSLIHTIQLARLTRLLKPHFNLHHLTAPYPCAAGPGVLPFFEGCGPYYRWLPSTYLNITSEQMKAGTSNIEMPPEVEELIKGAVEEVKGKGGKVVGLVGFSQGTRVSAGLMMGRELLFGESASAASSSSSSSDEEVQGLKAKYGWLQDFHFFLSVCGSFPPPLVPAGLVPLLPSSSSSSSSSDPASTSTSSKPAPFTYPKITAPTLHVLGTHDEWTWAGKLLIDACFEVEQGKSEVLTLDIGHHYPVKPEDSEKIANWAKEAYEMTSA